MQNYNIVNFITNSIRNSILNFIQLKPNKSVLIIHFVINSFVHIAQIITNNILNCDDFEI